VVEKYVAELSAADEDVAELNSDMNTLSADLGEAQTDHEKKNEIATDVASEATEATENGKRVGSGT